MQPVTQSEQMACVLRGVVEHVGRERSHAPVGALMFLVELEPEILLEQRRQSERLDAKQLRRHSRVEQMRDTPPVILMQQTQIVVGIVQHHLDIAIFEQCAEFLGRTDRQWIDHRFVVFGGKLQQVDSIDEAMEARTFCIERERAHAGESGQKAINGVSRVEIEWRGRRRHVCL